MRQTNSTNIHLTNLVSDLKKSNEKIWKRIAKDLSKPARHRRTVNISKINKNSKDNETIVVPGKVLSLGELDHKVTVAALSFSETAKRKINAKGKTMTIRELMKANASKIRILG